MTKYIFSSSLKKHDEIDAPEIIYKYRTWDNEFHKRFITEREIFLASPNTFEDELDCKNPTRFDLLDDRQIFEFYFKDSKQLNPHFNRSQHRDFAKKNSKYASFRDKRTLEKWQKETFDQYCKRTGILSLTANPNNPKMWEKYADNGKGICIGYNSQNLFKFLGGGGKVHYMDKLPTILPFPFTSHEEALFKRVYCKTSFWSFEDEYRTNMFWPNGASIHDRQIKLDKECFARVILGDNLSNLEIEDIKENIIHNIGKIDIIKKCDL